MKIGKKIYFGLATIVVVLLGVILRTSIPLTGDALSEYDYFYFQSNHIAVYGTLAFWNPYLYIGQKISSGFLFHFITAPDFWLTFLLSKLKNPISFATIFSISRSVEWLLTYAACYLLGRHWKLNTIASFFLGTVICISYSPISQIWSYNIVIQFLWVIYFIFRYQKNETLMNAIFMTLSVLYLLFSTKIVGLMMCLPPLIVLLIHPSTVRIFRRTKILIPCAFILILFLVPAYLVVKENTKYYHYANRSTGNYLSFKGKVADDYIEKTQKKLNSDAFDMRGVLVTRDWSELNTKIEKSNLYMVQDIGGYGGIALHVLAISGMFAARITYRRRLLACMIVLFVLARFPIILVKLPLPDIVVFIFNIRYFSFMFGTLKCFTMIFAALGFNHLIGDGKLSLWENIGISITSAAIIYAGTANFLLVFAVLLLPTLHIFSDITSKKGVQVLAYLLILISVGELNKIQYQLISMKRNPDIVASPQDRLKDYPFKSLVFRSRREVNPIRPKYAFQNASHQLDTPLPVLVGGKPAGKKAFYIAKCYYSLLYERTPDEVNQLNGIDNDIISFFPNKYILTTDRNELGPSVSQISLRTQEGGAVVSELQYDVVRYDANHFEARVKTAEPGTLRLAVLSDSNWSAWVDGAQVPVGTVDHCLQAISLDSGQHYVKLEYDPKLLQSLAFLLAFISLFIFALRIGCVFKAATQYCELNSEKK